VTNIITTTTNNNDNNKKIVIKSCVLPQVVQVLIYSYKVYQNDYKYYNQLLMKTATAVDTVAFFTYW
jgi:hypothetical protein